MGRKNGGGSTGGTPDGAEGDLPRCTDDSSEPAVEWVISSAPGSARGYLAADDPEFKRHYPSLSGWLTLTGRKGVDRLTGSVIFFCEEGSWKCCLNDKETKQVAFLSAKTVQGLVDAMEQGLKTGRLDWRASKRK